MDAATVLPDKSTAVIFTNNLGQVIFVDELFLNIMHYPEAGVVTGEPLGKVLRLDQQRGKYLLEGIRKDGRVIDSVIDITDSAGQPLRLSVSGLASRDPNGNFLGADITLQKLIEAAALTEVQPSALTIPTRQLLSEAAFTEGDQFLQLYFTTHLKALYVLFQRLLGLMARDQLDRIINQAAQKHGWALQIKSGLFAADLTQTSPEAYYILLREVTTYGVNMIGKSLVAREVDKVDQGMHAGVVSLAQQNGLYQFYKNK